MKRIDIINTIARSGCYLRMAYSESGFSAAIYYGQTLIAFDQIQKERDAELTTDDEFSLISSVFAAANNKIFEIETRRNHVDGIEQGRLF